MNLNWFLESNTRNAWTQSGNVSCYVRKSVRIYNNRWIHCLDLASGSVPWELRGQGLVTEFVKNAEFLAAEHGYRYIFIENVLEERFCDFFRKKGYNLYSNNVTPCFIKEL